MDKRKMWLYLLIFVLGISAGLAISSISRQKETGSTAIAKISRDAETVSGETLPPAPSLAQPSSKTDSGSHTETTSVPPPVTALSTPPSYPEWDQDATYTGGDQVVYAGRIYKAKWWTLGEIPGRADVWEYTLETPKQPAIMPTAPETAAPETTPHLVHCQAVPMLPAIRSLVITRTGRDTNRKKSGWIY